MIHSPDRRIWCSVVPETPADTHIPTGSTSLPSDTQYERIYALTAVDVGDGRLKILTLAGMSLAEKQGCCQCKGDECKSTPSTTLSIFYCSRGKELIHEYATVSLPFG